MLHFIKQGWTTTRYQTPIVLLLFLYQFTWGFILYKFIQSIVIPLLHRYPGIELSSASLHIFFAEGQFQVIKTNLIYSYLWILLALLLVRMLLTPLINAGLYYSIHHTDQKKVFLAGVKRIGKPFLLIYWLQVGITFAPLYWLIPKVIQVLEIHYTYESIALALLPYIVGFIIYGSLIYLLSMYIQFGATTGTGIFQSLKVVLRFIFPVIGISFILFIFAAFAALTLFTVSMVWAGFIAMLLHQIYYLLRTLFKVWELSSQYHFWKESSKQY